MPHHQIARSRTGGARAGALSGVRPAVAGARLPWLALVCCLAIVPALSIALATQAIAGEQSIELEIPVFEGGEGLDFFFECAREYEKERPRVTVNLYGDPRIADKLRVRMLEGTYPDITNGWLNYPALIRNGKVLQFDEYLDGPSWEGDGTWRESFVPGSLDRYTVEGKVYGIPLSYFIFTAWYNKRMFDEHGWAPARTWDEFFELCDQIKAAGIAPIAFQGQYTSYAQGLIDAAYYHLAGVDRYRDQQNILPGSFANAELEQALAIVQRVAVDYFQPGAMGMSHTGAQQEFFLGRTAMVFCGTWLKSEMMGKIPDGFKLGAFNIPIPAKGVADPTAVQATSGYYFVFTDSAHPRESVDFLRFMTSRRMAKLFAQQRDIPVAVRGVNEHALSDDLAEVVAIINAARTSYGSAATEIAVEMGQCWSDVRFKILTNKMTPAEAAQHLEAGAETIRNRLANPDRITVNHVVKPLILLGLLAAATIVWLLTTVGRIRRNRRAGQAAPLQEGIRVSRRNVLMFVGPAALLYTIFVIVPCLKSFAWSTQRWDGLTEMAYIGLLHFKRLLFESDGFWIALKNNLFIMFVVPLFVLPLSLFFAACISRRVLLSGLFRIVFFFPNVLGGIAATLLWMHMYHPKGLIDSALASIGRGFSWLGTATLLWMHRYHPEGPIGFALANIGRGFSWLGAPLESFADFAWLSQDHLYWALIPMAVWGACGFNMILFLAAMESIPQTLYEAAEIDGASAWRQFRTITLPLIWDVLAIAIVFMVIGGMKTFEVIWLLTNQTPTTETHVIGTRMVQAMFSEFKVGEATAIAVLLFLMVFFGTVATLRVMRRERVEF